jgi:aerotaxis receptor
MRLNEPTTDREYALPPHRTLVSVTDLKGRITYCNAAFVEVSGFEREALIGQPHNIVRHPDMPEEAFRDMWDTIQAGLPWTGLVKNRRRDGDHYWVLANATPMKDGDRLVGFMSVRSCPSRQAVAEAEVLYALMRDEAARGRPLHGLHRGQVRRLDAVGRLRRLLRPGLRGRLAGVNAAATLSVAAVAWASGPWAWLAAPLAAALSTWCTWRLAVSPLRGVIADAHHLASGDLSRSVVVGADGLAGELQQALMQLSVNLRTVVGDTRAEMASVQAAAAEIASGNLDLSARTESQASSLQQTAASMEQITGTVGNSAQAAAEGARLAVETASIAQRSNAAVEGVAQTMEGITQSSKRIGEIIGVVEDVAFQTNILALNAAVEAARAGPAGRGFAVVASEVRGLAQRTSGAAREIRQLIVESAERVDAGRSRTEDARQRMGEALGAVSKVTSALDEIRNAAVEQEAGISQVNLAVSQMDAVTQQNAALVEQLAASAQGLRHRVDAVNDSMRLFRLETGDRTVAEDDAVAARRQAKRPAPGLAPTPARAKSLDRRLPA